MELANYIVSISRTPLASLLGLLVVIEEVSLVMIRMAWHDGQLRLRNLTLKTTNVPTFLKTTRISMKLFLKHETTIMRNNIIMIGFYN